jgi:capsular polysaccharide biosynthesis protein
VRLTEAEIALISSAPVLDSVIDKFDLLVDFDGNRDDAKEYLTKKITWKFDKKTGLSTIVSRAETPERAKEMSKTVIVSLLTELMPKGKNKAKLEQVILSNEGVIANNIDAIEQLKRQMAKTSLSDANLDVMMKHYAALNSEVSSKQLENIELKENLKIKGVEVYVQQPNFPQRRVSPKILVVISLAYLGAIFLLLIYVFTLKALVTIKKNQEAVRKIENIKHYLGFK